MDAQTRRRASSSRDQAPHGHASKRRAATPEKYDTVLHLQRVAGNAAVTRLLASGRPGVQRLVDEDEAKKRVTTSEYKDVKERLEANGGGGMGTLYTGQFIRLASLFRKNRDALNMLKRKSLEHLAASEDYVAQENFVASKLHEEVEGFSSDKQISLIDNAVTTTDLLQSLASLSVQSMKHIAVPKHAWHLVVASPATFQPSNEAAAAQLHDPSWQQVAAVMGVVIGQGRQTLYKKVFQRIHSVGGQDVAVTFGVVDGKPRVSDAWVGT
jgi:predicted house-cleaning noncanonical NTP pyrophosphatase (MazG superfamily)